MSDSTRDTLVERYHDLAPRWDVYDAEVQQKLYREYGLQLGAWLPQSCEARILDAGCGEGLLLRYLVQRGYSNTIGLDLSPQNIEICRAFGMHQVQQGDLQDTPLLAQVGEFDLILLLDVVEHLPKQRAIAILQRLRLALRPHGSLIVRTPNAGSIGGLHQSFDDLTHEFVITEKSARSLFMGSGFAADMIEICPAWAPQRWIGRLRENYLALVHFLIFAGMGRFRPRIASPNLLIRARCGP